jgi:DNA-binding protein H-NS
MKPDMLDGFEDVELRAVIARAGDLLAQHDRERKEKAMNEARATLAAVGLSLKDLNGKGSAKSAKGAHYRGGHRYQHPDNKSLVWNARGQKPHWLRELETQGGKALELPQ